jgi:hypothetical protein
MTSSSPVVVPRAVAVQFAAVVLLSAVSAVSNLVLFATVFRSKHLRSTVGNAPILNLGVVGLTSAVVVLPVFAVTVLVGAPHGGTPTSAVCSAVAFGTQALFVESIATLAVVGVDRYLSICHPLHYARLVTSRTMTVGIGEFNEYIHQ